MPPIHPYFVHFPIGLLLFSVAIDLAGYILRKTHFTQIGWWSQLVGTISLSAALGTGLMAGNSAQVPPAASPFLEMHEQLVFVAAALLFSLLFWRIASRTMLPPRHSAIFLFLYVGSILLLCAGAWYGGELVYKFGVGVSATRGL